jgi:ribosome-associated toxin RatA of RatAB toxin-antitoxin module
MRKTKSINQIETFGLREQLAETAGESGNRTSETMEAIRHQLGAMLKYTGDCVYQADLDVFDKPEILDLLTDIQVLADEITQFYNSEIKLKDNECRKRFEAEKQRSENRFIL